MYTSKKRQTSFGQLSFLFSLSLYTHFAFKHLKLIKSSILIVVQATFLCQTSNTSRYKFIFLAVSEITIAFCSLRHTFLLRLCTNIISQF